jgi:chemotaxis protein CheD
MKTRDESGEIRRTFFDHRFGVHVHKVLPGEYLVGDGEDVIVTVLGSCVAACLRDPRLGFGGMNHFMLPSRGAGSSALLPAAFGLQAMELLIGELVKRGSRREALEAKVFGGAAVTEAFSYAQVGIQNSNFIIEYLRDEGIKIVAADLEGVYPRKVYFAPGTGRVDVKYLRSAGRVSLYSREAAYLNTIERAPSHGTVDLF